jgi:dCMP deaminase
MKDKHIKIRIEQCLLLSKASNCPRRKFGALLLDPKRNVVLMDGYNGAPRDGGVLCGGFFCNRDGLKREQFTVSYYSDYYYYNAKFPTNMPPFSSSTYNTEEEAWAAVDEIVKKHQPVKSGTRLEIGCHHAEMNVICNAAANGVSTDGGWLFVNGSCCLMCAKLIHHAGIKKVIVIAGQYSTEEGMLYLNKYNIDTEYRDALGNLIYIGEGI